VLELAILGLLKEKPMHGYELKKRLSFMLGHFWTVSYGSLYPALKRLEKQGGIERAYSVKEKTRNRNVYRITSKGEADFMRLLADTRAETALSDTEKFDIRMAFFQYLTPETRLRLLEKRRSLLEEQVKSFKAYKSSNRNQDHYQSGLLSHKVDQTRSDIRWLDRLIAHEREMIEEHPVEKLDKEKKVEQKGGQQAPLEGESRRVSAAGA
jgi:DNA-binding PadR family transcriptional regulator